MALFSKTVSSAEALTIESTVDVESLRMGAYLVLEPDLSRRGGTNDDISLLVALTKQILIGQIRNPPFRNMSFIYT